MDISGIHILLVLDLFLKPGVTKPTTVASSLVILDMVAQRA
jgi:hypothetical protein